MQPTSVPELDSSLAADCPKLDAPAGDYDAWLGWMTGTVLPTYADCASRHHRTVEAWPKPTGKKGP